MAKGQKMTSLDTNIISCSASPFCVGADQLEPLVNHEFTSNKALFYELKSHLLHCVSSETLVAAFVPQWAMLFPTIPMTEGDFCCREEKVGFVGPTKNIPRRLRTARSPHSSIR